MQTVPAPSTNKVCVFARKPGALGLIYSVWRWVGLRWSEVLAWEKRGVAYAIDLEPEASLMLCWEVLHSAWQPPEMQFHSHPSPTLSTRKYQGSQLPQRPKGANAARATLLAPSASGSIIMSACHWLASVHISTPEVFFFSVWLFKQHYWGITSRKVAINGSSLHGLLGLFSFGLSQNQSCNDASCIQLELTELTEVFGPIRRAFIQVHLSLNLFTLRKQLPYHESPSIQCTLFS